MPQLDSTAPTPCSQREQCQEALLINRDSLFETLNTLEQQNMVESGSLLGRKWLSVIPFNPSLRLSDFEISAALHLRTLFTGVGTHCRHYGVASRAKHDEVFGHLIFNICSLAHYCCHHGM
jgi:hypothetical protein